MIRFKIKIKQYIAAGLASLILLSTSCSIHADQEVLTLFPIENYDQSVSTWINPNSQDYDKPLISDDVQAAHMKDFYNHYFGDSSPWNADYVNSILKQSSPDNLAAIEQSLITTFSNNDKTGPDVGYAENYRPHSQAWLDDIATNINASAWPALSYQADHRAIAIDNLHARILPTDDVYLNSFKYAGSGYPFDNLQISAVWAGTPVYVIVESNDHAWSLVLTPDFIGWVKSNGLAYANTGFINAWTTNAKNHLAAIIKTQTTLVEKTTHRYYMTTYIGSVFPTLRQSDQTLTLMVPTADANRNAVIKYIDVSTNNAALMPVAITPHNMATIISSLKGRPYGWGSMYFYNDCSAELKSLYTPFGIYLMRHSSDQINSGKLVDESAATKEQRLAYLMENGHKLTTIIYLGGHVVMYVGNYPNRDGTQMAMTYQDMWGLSPTPSVSRSVVGGSVFLPMLLQFPEDATLNSQANKKFFQVSYLDQLPVNEVKAAPVDLRVLMNFYWNK